MDKKGATIAAPLTIAWDSQIRNVIFIQYAKTANAY